MYWQVYLHKTSVAAEQMLQKILARAKHLASEGKQLFASPALRYFLYNNITADDFLHSDNALQQYALLDDTDILSAIKVWVNSDDRVLSLLCEAFTNRRLFKVKMLEKPITDEEIQSIRSDYMRNLKISAEEAGSFFVYHSSVTNAYSAKDDSIDILFQDGTIRDIAEASDMLNLQVLTKIVEKHYLFYYK